MGTVLAPVISALSIAACLFGPGKIKGLGRLSVAIDLQALAATVFYYCVR